MIWKINFILLFNLVVISQQAFLSWPRFGRSRVSLSTDTNSTGIIGTSQVEPHVESSSFMQRIAKMLTPSEKLLLIEYFSRKK